jgi:hypothetical protein
MPTYHDFIFDNGKNEPTYAFSSSTGVVMEFHGLPDPASPNDPVPEMRLKFLSSQFAGKFKTTGGGGLTVPTTSGPYLVFTGSPGMVRGKPCSEIRIMLDPSVSQTPGGYQYKVEMRKPGGSWVQWDPRIVPK